MAHSLLGVGGHTSKSWLPKAMPRRMPRSVDRAQQEHVSNLLASTPPSPPSSRSQVPVGKAGEEQARPGGQEPSSLSAPGQKPAPEVGLISSPLCPARQAPPPRRATSAPPAVLACFQSLLLHFPPGDSGDGGSSSSSRKDSQQLQPFSSHLPDCGIRLRQMHQWVCRGPTWFAHSGC